MKFRVKKLNLVRNKRNPTQIKTEAHEYDNPEYDGQQAHLHARSPHLQKRNLSEWKQDSGDGKRPFPVTGARTGACRVGKIPMFLARLVCNV